MRDLGVSNRRESTPAHCRSAEKRRRGVHSYLSLRKRPTCGDIMPPSAGFIHREVLSATSRLIRVWNVALRSWRAVSNIFESSGRCPLNRGYPTSQSDPVQRVRPRNRPRSAIRSYTDPARAHPFPDVQNPTEKSVTFPSATVQPPRLAASRCKFVERTHWPLRNQNPHLSWAHSHQLRWQFLARLDELGPALVSACRITTALRSRQRAAQQRRCQGRDS